VVPAFIVFILVSSSINIFSLFFNSVVADSTSEPEIEYLAIDVDIDNNYATTEIHEMFTNPYNYSLDETFKFQIPEKAFISNFSLTLDNETHYAKIVPKEIGEQKYQDAVINGTDAGLVQSVGKNVFSYSISLSPYQEIIVGLRYEQFIEKSLGGYRYTIPLSGGDHSKNVKDFSIDMKIRSKLFVNDVQLETYYDSAKVHYYSANEARVSYQTENSVTSEDLILVYELSNPPINGTMLNYNDGTEEFFFHIFSPQRSDLGGKAMDKEIIFILDKSGSMQGTKIEQLKAAFEEIIGQLPADDYFNIIYFDSVVKQYKTELIIASESNKDDAVKYINNMEAGGSTNFNEALLTGLDMFEISETKVPIIVMLTDGLPTAGVTNLASIRENVKEKNTASVGIFCLGFGYDVDFEFLKALSLENYGLAQRISEGEDASEQITDFYSTISTPLLKGLTFDYYKGAYEVYPESVDQLFEGTEVIVVGKYDSASQSITSTVEATSWDGMRTFEETFVIENETDYDFIPRFWAYAKIQHLLDEITVSGKNNSLVENVTALALEYGFVTPYTSLLVEIKEPDEEPDDDTKTDNDPDGDGLPDDYDPGPTGSSDSDNDGIPDDWELAYGMDPYDPSDASGDYDGDGYSNSQEHYLGTDPTKPTLKPKKQSDSGGDGGFWGNVPEENTYLERYGPSVSIPFLIFIIVILLTIIIFAYTRIKHHKVLEQKRREMIYNYIKENPGEHFRGIQKALGLESGVVGHHVNILEREDLVKSRQDGMYRRFYPMDATIDMGLILTKIQERILSWIKMNPGNSQSNIATTLNINRKVVGYHIKILQDAGFVYTEKEGRESLCFSAEPV
jgi:uncharacterized protein YegL/DNA-binding MarR family transcriptional regulator